MDMKRVKEIEKMDINLHKDKIDFLIRTIKEMDISLKVLMKATERAIEKMENETDSYKEAIKQQQGQIERYEKALEYYAKDSSDYTNKQIALDALEQS